MLLYDIQFPGVFCIFCSFSTNIYITIRDNRVKFNDGNLKFVRDSGEFEISEFEITE